MMANKDTQQLITQTNTNTSKKLFFIMKLCKAMLSANIPLNKRSNKAFRHFLETYTGKDTPHENIAKRLHR